MTAVLARRRGTLDAPNAVAGGATLIVANNFEGLSNGTAVTTSNSGGASGTAFDAVNSAVSGQILQADTGKAAHGSVSLQLGTTTTAGSVYTAWSTAVGTQTTIWVRMYLYFTAFPAASSTIWRALSAGAAACNLQVTSAGILRLQNTAANVNTSLPTALPLNQWFRVEWAIGASTTAGTFDLRRYDTMDAATGSPSAAITATGQVLTANFDTYRFGLQTSTASWGPIWYDNIAMSVVGFCGPAAASGGYGFAPFGSSAYGT